VNNGNRIATDLPFTPNDHSRWLPEIAVFVAAIIGRLPTMGAWWNQDDWGYLARAAGLDSGEAVAWPTHWLSQHLYWDLTWPLFGLNSDAHAVIRLILHGVAAVLIVRIAWRTGLGPLSRLLAGLVFAASPLAYTPLYWATGIREILAAVFALAAVERWLAAKALGRRQLAWATVLAVLSMFSRETGLGLPLLFLGFAWARVGVRLEDKAFAWAMIMAQLLAAITAGVLVGGNTSAGEPGAALRNLGACGWWLVSPGPFLATNISAIMASAGGLLFVVWAGWGIVRWRQESPLTLTTLASALLVMAPAVLLTKPLTPFLIYLAAAPFGLALADIFSQFKTARLDRLGQRPLLGFMALVAVAWGFFGMEARLGKRDDLGLVADPLARITALSWQGCHTIQTLQNHPNLKSAPDGGLTHLTLMQPLVGADVSDMAMTLGERWARHSDMYKALGGTLGPRLMLTPQTRVSWVNGLTTASSSSVVLCETATGFRLWGRLENAVLYAALTDIGLGHYERARGHLIRAADLSGEQIMFIYDEGQMVIPLQMVLDHRKTFTDWTLSLLDRGVPRLEVGGLQDLFFNLLSNSTGHSREELTAGSRLITAP